MLSFLHACFVVGRVFKWTPIRLLVLSANHSPLELRVMADVIALDTVKPCAKDILALQMLAWFTDAFRV